MILVPLLALSLRVSTVNVFAAASLKESFTAIAARYEHAHPGVRVNLNFGGSQLLAAQINGGAPADVFASADETNLRKVRFVALTFNVFAANELILVGAKGFTMRTVGDLANAKRIVVADDPVPAGHYTDQFLEKAGKQLGGGWLATVRARIVSKEQDVKAVLAKVRLGEADAGVVYVTDAKEAGNEVSKCCIPSSMNEVAEYVVAAPASASNPRGGHDFISFVLGKESQDILRADGFLVHNQ